MVETENKSNLQEKHLAKSNTHFSLKKKNYQQTKIVDNFFNPIRNVYKHPTANIILNDDN